jgi:hypothetical protein
MDIAGAKALKERLGPQGAQEAPADLARTELPADAPPVYHWTGVSKVPSNISRADREDASGADNASLFSRLGLSFR